MNPHSINQPDVNLERNLDSEGREQIDSLIELLIEPETDKEDTELSQQQSDADLSIAQAWNALSEASVEEGDLSETQLEDYDNTEARDREIEVEIDSEPEPTLAEAVEYRAFLRQTIDSDPESSEIEVDNAAAINSLEKVEAIDTEQASTEELADAVNSLIPLIVSLLEFKLDNSQEGIIQTVRPVIDRLIQERTAEDSPKMASAIARLLPAAIEDEIKLNPQAIARAIAPEIALSIRQQILLDKDAIPETLGPEMGKAIKAQIESEKDAMVDALYPVIGNTIAKYMVEVVREINAKVERNFSLEGIKRKFQAKMQGVSEAELIFKESVGYRVRAIFLIDKDSGLVIQEIQLPGEEHLDSDMLAGMLTAIRSFANDCIASGSELDSIDYGDWQIPIEVGGYCYLAVIVAGEPPKDFIVKIRKILGEIILEHDEVIQNFDGNTALVPVAIKNKLQKLTQTEPAKPRSSSPILLWLLILLLGLSLIFWGRVGHRSQIAERIEQFAATQLDAAPELSVYRLDPTVEEGKLTIKGRVPSNYLRDRAAVVVGDLARQNQLEVNNQILAVDVPPDLDVVRGEIERLTNLFNQRAQVSIRTDYQDRTLTVTGFVLDPAVRQTIGRTFRQIPGVVQVVFDLDSRLPLVQQQIFFNSGSNKLNLGDNFSKINAVKQLLQRYPQLHLKLVVHSDDVGSAVINRKLGNKRCQNVKNALVVRGIKANRLTTNCNSPISAKTTDNNGALWSKQYVSFEPFIPANSQ